MPDTPYPTVAADDLPWLTTEQIVEVDRRMMGEQRITLIQMMENAGRHLARLAADRYLVGSKNPSVLVLAGRGGNGGGALVAARRLRAWGFRVSVILTADEDIHTGVPAQQLAAIAALRLPIVRVGDVGLPSAAGDRSAEDTPTLILDGLIGYSLQGAPRKAESSLIRFANAALCPILSLDLPSGLDAHTGEAFEPAIEADATLTLALPKVGLRAEGAEKHVGDLYVGDIGVLPVVYDRMEIDFDASLFAEGEILRIE